LWFLQPVAASATASTSANEQVSFIIFIFFSVKSLLKKAKIISPKPVENHFPKFEQYP